MPRKKIAHKPNQVWPKDIRHNAIADYAVLGSIKAVSRAYPDVPYDTIRAWVNSDDGVELIATLHAEKTTELRQKYVDVCELAIDQTKAKLPDATAAQAAVISGVFFDKTRLIDNAPTSISGRTDSLESLKDQFRKLSSTHTIVPNAKIIDNTNDDEDESH